VNDSPLLFREVELADGRRADVRLAGGRVTEVGATLAGQRAELVVEAGGAALIPGLHDHHLHLLALAAARTSVRAGPPEVTDHEGLRRALRAAPGGPGTWIRAVGYHESVAGELDRHALDQLVADRPLRLQHRSGALWMLNSAGLARIGLDPGPDHVPAGVERDQSGRPTGRLYRLDGWLRDRLGTPEPPDLAGVGRALAQAGVTGLTDATATTGPGELALLQAATARGDLPQRLTVMGPVELGSPERGPVERSAVAIGPVKVVLVDDDLPDPAVPAATVAAAHQLGRPVAFHCVTLAELVVALAALRSTGARPGDRIEHGGVVPAALVPDLATLGLTVVTQPSFVAERGDDYLAEVDPADLDALYPCASLVAAGIPVAASTDAPFGPADPWRAVAAAVARTTRSGRVLGPGERVGPRRALDLFLGPAADPGGPPRRLVPGAPADCCLLRGPLDAVLGGGLDDPVALTVVDGAVVADRR
jgi:predicted amidohydrolase YtcJ